MFGVACSCSHCLPDSFRAPVLTSPDSAIGDVPPAEFEAAYYASSTTVDAA
jgi:hypothetical protein